MAQVAAFLTQSRMWDPLGAVIQILASCSNLSPLDTAWLSPKLSIVNRMLTHWLWLRPSLVSSRASVWISHRQKARQRNCGESFLFIFFPEEGKWNGRVGRPIWLWAVNTCYGATLNSCSRWEEIVSVKVWCNYLKLYAVINGMVTNYVKKITSIVAICSTHEDLLNISLAALNMCWTFLTCTHIFFISIYTRLFIYKLRAIFGAWLFH